MKFETLINSDTYSTCIKILCVNVKVFQNEKEM